MEVKTVNKLSMKQLNATPTYALATVLVGGQNGRLVMRLVAEEKLGKLLSSKSTLLAMAKTVPFRTTTPLVYLVKPKIARSTALVNGLIGACVMPPADPMVIGTAVLTFPYEQLLVGRLVWRTTQMRSRNLAILMCNAQSTALGIGLPGHHATPVAAVEQPVELLT